MRIIEDYKSNYWLDFKIVFLSDSCLKCNLERKSRDADKFRDGKQMVVIRKE